MTIRLLRDIPEEYYVVYSQEEIDPIAEYFGIKDTDITGAAVNSLYVAEGDYGPANKVFFTESSAPYDLHSLWHPATYYMEDMPTLFIEEFSEWFSFGDTEES